MEAEPFSYDIPLIRRDSDTSIMATFYGDFANKTVDGNCTLFAKYDGKTISANRGDYFDALKVLRLSLEAEGWFPVCYGASRNAWASAMSCEMGGGWLVYLLQIGRQPESVKEMVRILDTGRNVDPVTVAEQEEFRDQFLANMGRLSEH